MKTKMLIPILCLILSALISCDANEPQVDKNTIKLSLIDVSVREAYLHIEAEKIRGNEDIVLFRNGKEVLSFKNTQKDTIIADTALTENTIYKYIVYGRLSNSETGKSEEITVTTLMPTSHEFSWQTYYLGDLGYCSCNTLYDAAIVNENDIWAVGEMYFKDSLGNVDTQIYGAVHWDGMKCTPVKVPWKDFGFSTPFPGALSTIAEINGNIYISNGGALLKKNQNIWQQKAEFIKSLPFDGRVRHMWGKDETSIYCAGDNGAVYHVNGYSWEQIDAGTKTDINDVWGITNSLTGDEITYLAVSPYGSFQSGNTDVKIIRITNWKKVDEIKFNSNSFLNTVWTDKGFPLFAGGDNIYTNKIGKWETYKEFQQYFTNSIRGNGLNDIFAAGNYGFLAHYNGKEWHTYPELYLSDGVYGSVRVKNDIVCLTGIDKGQAILTIGRR